MKLFGFEIVRAKVPRTGGKTDGTTGSGRRSAKGGTTAARGRTAAKRGTGTSRPKGTESATATRGTQRSAAGKTERKQPRKAPEDSSARKPRKDRQPQKGSKEQKDRTAPKDRKARKPRTDRRDRTDRKEQKDRKPRKPREDPKGGSARKPRTTRGTRPSARPRDASTAWWRWPATGAPKAVRGPKGESTGAGEPAAAPGGPAPLQASPTIRALVMLLAFAAMVAFAVVLARLTLMPSAASVRLTHTNLRPGDSIRAYLQTPGLRDAVKQVGGNVLLGMPFGLLLPVLWPRARGLLRVAVGTALVMVMVELVQGAIVTGRAFDIDDVILNTTGALVGYLVLGRRMGRALHPRRHHWWHRFTHARRPAG